MPDSPSLINIGDLGAPLSKLIETVGSAVGVMYEPTRIIKRAEAEVVAAKIKAEGDAELRALAARSEERLSYIELRRQRNIDAIVNEAKKALPKSVSEEKVDEDWTAFFFENCKDVSNEQMRLLWAKVLAGEVAQPGSSSLRTLETIRLMTQEEAQFIQVVSRRLIYIQDKPVLLDSETYNRDFDAGQRVYGGELAGHGYLNLFGPKYSIMFMGPDTYVTYMGETSNYVEPFELVVYKASNVGRELFQFCDAEPLKGYFSNVKRIIEKSVEEKRSRRKRG
jgi:hypothetical protein